MIFASRFWQGSFVQKKKLEVRIFAQMNWHELAAVKCNLLRGRSSVLKSLKLWLIQFWFTVTIELYRLFEFKCIHLYEKANKDYQYIKKNLTEQFYHWRSCNDSMRLKKKDAVLLLDDFYCIILQSNQTLSYEVNIKVFFEGLHC